PFPNHGSLSLTALTLSKVTAHDNIETIQVQEYALSVLSPLLKQNFVLGIVDTCHGLVCLHIYKDKYYIKKILVVWNPCIGKSFGIGIVPMYDHRTYSLIVYGFGVCPVTSDPTVVKVLSSVNKPWHVGVFTLSLGVWNVIPSSNLPCQSIELNNPKTQVVIDRFIYWGACEKTFNDDGEATVNYMVVSFHLITKEFKVVNLPDTLTNELYLSVCVCKLRGSLVVSGYIKVEGALCYGVWMMEHDSSFRKLFTIGVR
ncbi:retrovirus-related pol polyprotein from transposon TNT 1-94, partial [Tanacetum coccineum]